MLEVARSRIRANDGIRECHRGIVSHSREEEVRPLHCHARIVPGLLQLSRERRIYCGAMPKLALIRDQASIRAQRRRIRGDRAAQEIRCFCEIPRVRVEEREVVERGELVRVNREERVVRRHCLGLVRSRTVGVVRGDREVVLDLRQPVCVRVRFFDRVNALVAILIVVGEGDAERAIRHANPVSSVTALRNSPIAVVGLASIIIARWPSEYASSAGSDDVVTCASAATPAGV